MNQLAMPDIQLNMAGAMNFDFVEVPGDNSHKVHRRLLHQLIVANRTPSLSSIQGMAHTVIQHPFMKNQPTSL